VNKRLVLILLLVIGAIFSSNIPVETQAVGYKYLATAKLNNKVGYVAKEGKFAFRKKFDAGNDFSPITGLAQVRDAQTYYFISTSGEEAFWGDAYKFDFAMPFVGNYAKVKKANVGTIGERWGVMDGGGNLYWVSPEVNYIGNVFENRIVIGTNDAMWHCSLPTMEPAYKKKYKRVSDYSHSLSAVQDFDDQCYLLNLDGQITFGPCQGLQIFAYGIAFKENGLWGVINFNLEVMIEPKYDQIMDVSRDTAIVWQDGEVHGNWICINLGTNKVMFEKTWIEISGFAEDVTTASPYFYKSAPSRCLINKSGDQISNAYSELKYLGNGLYLASINQYKKVIIDSTGAQVYPVLDPKKDPEYLMDATVISEGCLGIKDFLGDAYHVSLKWIKLFESKYEEVGPFVKIEIKK